MEGISQSVSNVDFTFNHWEFESSNIGSSNPKSDFRPTSHGTLKAKFTGIPNTANRNQRVTSSIGQYVTIAWDAHPNGDVTQYRVYRKVDSGAEQLLTTTSSLSYTDYEYTQTGDPSDYRLLYDVRPYYSPDGTESTAYFQSIVFGELRIDDNNSKQEITMSETIPTEYSITNYPNPFNPTTTINYQLPENGFVTIKVYDLLGKEVAILVNESKSAGYHRVNFDASKLTSGVYIYTITANNFIQSKKMLLMK